MKRTGEPLVKRTYQPDAGAMEQAVKKLLSQEKSAGLAIGAHNDVRKDQDESNITKPSIHPTGA